MTVLMIILACLCTKIVAKESAGSLAERLKSINYDKRQRPYFHDKVPVNVTVQLTIHTIGPIDEARFTFQFGFYFRQWWKDPRLIMNTTASIHSTALDNLIWTPDTSVSDSQELKTFDNAVRTEVNLKTGEVYLSKRLRAITNCNMNLRFYPLDKQSCEIVFETYAFTTSDLEIFWHTIPALEKEGMTLDGYNLKKITTYDEKVHSLVGNQSQSFKLLKLSVSVKRTYMYHIYRAYIPSILLLTFAFGSFWVPDAAVPARMAMIVTSFLANIFILQGVTEKTVKVSYTTPLQVFLVVNVAVIVLSLMEYILVLQLRRLSQVKAKRRIRKTTIRNSKQRTNSNQNNDTTPFIKDDNNICLKTVKTDKDIENDVEANIQKYVKKQKTKTHQIHIIDYTCRVVFPLTYFIFCTAYFGYYVNR